MNKSIFPQKSLNKQPKTQLISLGTMVFSIYITNASKSLSLDVFVVYITRKCEQFAYEIQIISHFESFLSTLVDFFLLQFFCSFCKNYFFVGFLDPELQ